MTLHHKLYLIGIGLALAVLSVAAYFFVQTERHTDIVMQDVDKSAVQFTLAETTVSAALKGDPKKGDPGLLNRASLLVANADSAMNALKQTMQTVNKVSKENADKTSQLTDASVATVRAGQQALAKLGDAIDTLNATIAVVRDTTLPRVDAGVDALDGVVAGLEPVEHNAAILLASGNEVTLGLKAAVGNANALLLDPDLTAVGHNLNLASANLNTGLGHFSNALGYVEADLKPVPQPWWKTLAVGALSQAMGIPLKYFPSRVAVVSSVPVKP